MAIDATARVAAGARIGEGVEIGPYCLVGPQVELQAGVRLVSHVNVTGVTTIGAGCVVYPFCSLGTPPQSVHYRGGATRLVVGAQCELRESVTMNTGTEDGGGVTEVGDRGFFMANCHVGHDCQVGNDVVLANCAGLGGHCIVGDHVFIGALSGVHQHIRIGAHAMIGGVSGVREHVIPFGLAAGAFARLSGINAVGMKRRKFSSETIRTVRMAFRRLFFGQDAMAQRLDDVELKYGGNESVAQIVAFIRNKGRRPLCHAGSYQEAS
jgi:UDP-N-acetylglucosamine acyltransferase